MNLFTSLELIVWQKRPPIVATLASSPWLIVLNDEDFVQLDRLRPLLQRIMAYLQITPDTPCLSENAFKQKIINFVSTYKNLLLFGTKLTMPAPRIAGHKLVETVALSAMEHNPLLKKRALHDFQIFKRPT